MKKVLKVIGIIVLVIAAALVVLLVRNAVEARRPAVPAAC